MLKLLVGATDVFDEETDTFGTTGGYELRLEHSLVSLSKWEEEFEKPFLGPGSRTQDEILAYIRCMILDEDPPEDFLHQLSEKNFEAINAHIDAKRTATWFSEIEPQTRNAETITSELIYYWMTIFKINWEAQYWHLNRLFTLIRVCNIKQSKPKKMSHAERARRNRELNERRRQELGTSG